MSETSFSEGGYLIEDMPGVRGVYCAARFTLEPGASTRLMYYCATNLNSWRYAVVGDGWILIARGGMVVGYPLSPNSPPVALASGGADVMIAGRGGLTVLDITNRPTFNPALEREVVLSGGGGTSEEGVPDAIFALVQAYQQSVQRQLGLV